MALSWNEIKDRALNFSKEWEGTTSEEADSQSFLIDFFNVFGIQRRKVATFEHKVKKLDDHSGYIDLLWKGHILIEMKSRGKDLDKAYQQARDYLHGLKDHELPRYMLISDFEIVRLYDLEEDETHEFQLNEFVNNIQLFGFIAGYQKRVFKEQDPVNIKAAELMGQLHDRLKEIGYDGHQLEIYLVRLLFLLFAEDSTIFEKQQFQDYIDFKTNEDGSDLASKLQELFQVLDTPEDKRFTNLDEHLAAFPYVNGSLFKENLRIAHFDSTMRHTLLECCYLDWSLISPAIFGSMFQSVMNPKERRNLGAHYTSEKNILKLIKPLFLDELWEEFEKIKSNKKKLNEFHQKLGTLKFLDPACGCGNFLIITYRELRQLELEVLKVLNKGQQVTGIEQLIFIDVDQFYGIEYDEFPAKIAEVAMWLMDHQMNMRISEEFGKYFARLPLSKSATIVNGNALRIDWEDVVPKDELDYILGNPPFYGKQYQTPEQRSDMEYIFKSVRGYGVLDYVTCWYLLASKFIENTNIKVAFVSTNSISQGEQVAILWKQLYIYKSEIFFAHRTFKWTNEAKGKAAVYCVIIGFNYNNITKKKILFDYIDVSKEPVESNVTDINPYLIEAKNILIEKRTNPLINVPKIFKGNQPTEGGYLLLNESEYLQITTKYSEINLLIKPVISGREFLNNIKRYCFWLVDKTPKEIKKYPELLERIENVRKMRLSSSFNDTKKLADFPTLFRDIKNPEKFIVIPATTSERRKYIPFGFYDKDFIPLNSVYIIPNATVYHFGMLMSEMHMSWVKYTCGRLESRFRYSKDIVYNNYPWPKDPSEKNKKKVETAAQHVLDVREEFPDSSLADLYDPLTMPPKLVKAHQALDKAVDLCYRPQAFTSDTARIEYLFDLYSEYTAGMFPEEKKKISSQSLKIQKTKINQVQKSNMYHQKIRIKNSF